MITCAVTVLGVFCLYDLAFNAVTKVISVMLPCVLAIVIMFAIIHNNSNVDASHSHDREVNIYSANGDLIANYNGEININEIEDGYVKFSCDGKTYIYYNCLVETIEDDD